MVEYNKTEVYQYLPACNEYPKSASLRILYIVYRNLIKVSVMCTYIKSIAHMDRP